MTISTKKAQVLLFLLIVLFLVPPCLTSAVGQTPTSRQAADTKNANDLKHANKSENMDEAGQAPAREPEPAPAQPQEESAPEPEVVPVSTVDTLIGIMESLEMLKGEIKAKEKELKGVRSEDQKGPIEEELTRLRKQLDNLAKDFESIATGVDMGTFVSRPQERFDWTQEFQELLSPIIQELKGMTARPREIEKLRNEVAYYEQRLPVARSALESLQKLLAETKDQKLKNRLTEAEKNWKNQEHQVTSQLNVAQYRLAEKLGEERSFLGSVQSIMQLFFKSRGRNFTVALLTFAMVFVLLQLAWRYLYRLVPKLNTSGRSFYIRLTEVIYQLMVFVWAATASLAALYILGDWALLSLAILFIFGIFWATRQALPKFWEEYKLLLNLGTVKENERVILNGLPWKVQSLNVYTQLINPELSGGVLNLPLSKLIGMHSRPYHSDEPWFPCKEHDWVILADGTKGKVVLQSPEIVQLVLLGGSRKTYPTEDFLKQSPQNISTGFRLNVTFGIDYQHQKLATREIPERMKHEIMDEFEREGHAKDLVDLKVELKEAGASSIDLAIIADFSGRVAKSYDLFARALQRAAVEACNKHGWVIPFPQVTIHTAAPEGDTEVMLPRMALRA